MRKRYLFIAFFVNILLSSAAQAHPGHDHSSIFSILVHSLPLIAMSAVILYGIYLLKKQKTSITMAKKGGKA